MITNHLVKFKWHNAPPKSLLINYNKMKYVSVTCIRYSIFNLKITFILIKQ